MYYYIVDPISKLKYDISSSAGKNIIKNYIRYIITSRGGAAANEQNEPPQSDVLLMQMLDNRYSSRPEIGSDVYVIDRRPGIEHNKSRIVGILQQYLLKDDKIYLDIAHDGIILFSVDNNTSYIEPNDRNQTTKRYELNSNISQNEHGDWELTVN